MPGRCRSTNLCDYCARLAAVENTEMLALDAAETDAPEVWLVLTTRTATLDMSEFYAARKQLMKAVRRRWPAAEYAALLEFTTGYGARSGGLRRPHWNLLLKGVPSSASVLRELRALVRRVWCAHVDALPAGQHVGAVRDAGGLMRYIALHFQKESQAPPEGFRGQRFNCSRGYFRGVSRAEAREGARDSLLDKRQLWKALQAGFEGQEAEDQVDRAWFERFDTQWRLYWRVRRPVPGVGAARAPVPELVTEAAIVAMFDAVLVGEGEYPDHGHDQLVLIPEGLLPPGAVGARIDDPKGAVDGDT